MGEKSASRRRKSKDDTFGNTLPFQFFTGQQNVFQGCCLDTRQSPRDFSRTKMAIFRDFYGHVVYATVTVTSRFQVERNCCGRDRIRKKPSDNGSNVLRKESSYFLNALKRRKRIEFLIESFLTKTPLQSGFLNTFYDLTVSEFSGSQ